MVVLLIWLLRLCVVMVGCGYCVGSCGTSGCCVCCWLFWFRLLWLSFREDILLWLFRPVGMYRKRSRDDRMSTFSHLSDVHLFSASNKMSCMKPLFVVFSNMLIKNQGLLRLPPKEGLIGYLPSVFKTPPKRWTSHQPFGGHPVNPTLRGTHAQNTGACVPRHTHTLTMRESTFESTH